MIFLSTSVEDSEDCEWTSSEDEEYTGLDQKDKINAMHGLKPKLILGVENHPKKYNDKDKYSSANRLSIENTIPTVSTVESPPTIINNNSIMARTDMDTEILVMSIQALSDVHADNDTISMASFRSR